jgi:hypothetical protein
MREEGLKEYKINSLHEGRFFISLLSYVYCEPMPHYPERLWFHFIFEPQLVPIIRDSHIENIEILI